MICLRWRSSLSGAIKAYVRTSLRAFYGHISRDADDTGGVEKEKKASYNCSELIVGVEFGLQ